MRDKENHLRLRREWYSRNRQKQIDLVKANNQRYAARLDALKNKPCTDCGGHFPPCAMDFDHRDAAQKLTEVSRLKSYALQRMLDEIAKCDLVCANCHRIRTWNRARSLTDKAQAS